jgi:hypothetical protein
VIRGAAVGVLAPFNRSADFPITSAGGIYPSAFRKGYLSTSVSGEVREMAFANTDRSQSHLAAYQGSQPIFANQ